MYFYFKHVQILVSFILDVNITIIHIFYETMTFVFKMQYFKKHL